MILAILRAALASLAASLPRRLWGSLEEHLPVHVMAFPSGLLPLALALGIGLPGFLRYGQDVAARNVDAMLDLAGKSADASSAMSVSFSMFTFFGFLFLSPLGLLTAYLGLSGAVRLIGVAAGDPMGDPLLTLVDRLVVSGSQRAVASRAAVARLREEGEEVPDRVQASAAFGLSGADYVLIASRRKPGWTAGATLVTDRGWFKLGEPFDRRMPEGLRTLYPLTRAPEAEVLRKAVPYPGRLPLPDEPSTDA